MSLKYPGPHFPAVSVVNVEASFPVVFPSGAVINLPTNAGDLGSFPGSGRSPGEGNSNPLQYSCLGNLWIEESGVLQSIGVTKSWAQLSD